MDFPHTTGDMLWPWRKWQARWSHPMKSLADFMVSSPFQLWEFQGAVAHIRTFFLVRFGASLFGHAHILGRRPVAANNSSCYKYNLAILAIKLRILTITISNVKKIIGKSILELKFGHFMSFSSCPCRNRDHLGSLRPRLSIPAAARNEFSPGNANPNLLGTYIM